MGLEIGGRLENGVIYWMNSPNIGDYTASRIGRSVRYMLPFLVQKTLPSIGSCGKYFNTTLFHWEVNADKKKERVGGDCMVVWQIVQKWFELVLLYVFGKTARLCTFLPMSCFSIHPLQGVEMFYLGALGNWEQLQEEFSW